MRGPVLPLVRRDALPDHATYADNGCELARSCLRCPLPRCQYDAPRSAERWLIAARDREIAYLRRRYRVPVQALARAYGVGERRVWSILRGRREVRGRREGEGLKGA